MYTWLNIVLVAMIFYCLFTWVHGVFTYDWTRFDEDQKQAIKDLF